jgi:glycosyltransferase involved in cell wall biosynthesis
MTLGGIVCIRDGNIKDYCWREAIASLLPVCDMVTVCDGESTDGTQEEIRQWMKREPKIVLCVYPWPSPSGDISFWVDWLQYARQHTPTDYVLQLDADEILSELSYPLVRAVKTGAADCPPFTIRCPRYNFWRDIRHLIPHGVCCAHEVIRLGPRNVFLPSDGPDPRGAQWTNMAVWLPLEIFHYGFLRKKEAFFLKARDLQKFFFNDYDQRLERAEKFDGNWMEMPGISGWENNLLDFHGEHPLVIRPWLKERGWL